MAPCEGGLAPATGRAIIASCVFIHYMKVSAFNAEAFESRTT
jgi:hypothetical protein